MTSSYTEKGKMGSARSLKRKRVGVRQNARVCDSNGRKTMAAAVDAGRTGVGSAPEEGFDENGGKVHVVVLVKVEKLAAVDGRLALADRRRVGRSAENALCLHSWWLVGGEGKETGAGVEAAAPRAKPGRAQAHSDGPFWRR